MPLIEHMRKENLHIHISLSRRFQMTQLGLGQLIHFTDGRFKEGSTIVEGMSSW